MKIRDSTNNPQRLYLCCDCLGKIVQPISIFGWRKNNGNCDWIEKQVRDDFVEEEEEEEMVAGHMYLSTTYSIQIVTSWMVRSIIKLIEKKKK